MIETAIGAIANPRERLLAFAKEREAIRLRRTAGQEKPWTDDFILQRFRFSNIYRELDVVTKWIADNWRAPHAGDPDLWFSFMVARLVNWPDSLGAIGYPVPWRPEHFIAVMQERKRAGHKTYSSAYMVRGGAPGVEKAIFQARDILNPLWAARGRLRPKPGDSLNSFHILLGQFYGLGSFLAAQIIADAKYVEPLRSAADWHSFAASGPGSQRGLNRLLGRPVRGPWQEDNWRLELKRLQAELQPRWAALDLKEPHAQDLQSCLCELDKYERVRLGEGVPRQQYDGVGRAAA